MKALSLPLSVLVIASCGGSSKTAPSTVEFPHGAKNAAGNYYVPVKDRPEADRLMEALCGAAAYKAGYPSWPAYYPDQVTFDVPGTGSDDTCAK